MSKINLLKYLIIYLIIPIALSNNLKDNNNKSFIDLIKENKIISIIIGIVIIIIILLIIYCCCCRSNQQKYTIASDMGLIDDKEKMISG